MINVITPNRMLSRAFGDYKIKMIIEIIFFEYFLNIFFEHNKKKFFDQKKGLSAGNPFPQCFIEIKLICLRHMVCWPLHFGLLKCIYEIIIIFY